MPVPAKARFKLDTHLDGWTLADPTEYLGRAGFGTIAPGAHEIYAMNHGGLRLLIPAIAVMKALFVPNAMFFNNLFRSVSVDFLVGPEWRPTTMTVAPFRLQHAHNVRMTESAMKRLQWIYCFPSARAAFSSVHFNAVNGVIGVTLPKMKAEISFRGTLYGNTLFVSSLVIMRMEPREDPFDWAGSQPTAIDSGSTEQARGLQQLNPPLLDRSLSTGPSGWGLSDSEWAQLKPLFAGIDRALSSERCRELLSAILTKLGTGTGWVKVNSGFGTVAAVSSYYQSCVRSGRWEAFESALAQLRSGAELVITPAFAREKKQIRPRRQSTPAGVAALEPTGVIPLTTSTSTKKRAAPDPSQFPTGRHIRLRTPRP